MEVLVMLVGICLIVIGIHMMHHRDIWMSEDEYRKQQETLEKYRNQ